MWVLDVCISHAGWVEQTNGVTGHPCGFIFSFGLQWTVIYTARKIDNSCLLSMVYTGQNSNEGKDLHRVSRFPQQSQ